QLDRLVRQVGGGVGDALDAVLRGPRAPGAYHDLGQHEGLLALTAADREQGRATLAGGDHALRHCLGERAHDSIKDTIADHATRGAGCREARIDNAALGRVDAHRAHVALAIGYVHVAETAD